MAYAVISGNWPKQIKISKRSNLIALVIIFLILPLINFEKAFISEFFYQTLPESLDIEDPGAFVTKNIVILWIIIIGMIIIAIVAWNKVNKLTNHMTVVLVFLLSAYYTAFSYIRNGLFYRGIKWEFSETMYLVILLCMGIVWFLNKDHGGLKENSISPDNSALRWAKLIAGLALVIIMITAISLNIHDGMPNAQKRY